MKRSMKWTVQREAVLPVCASEIVAHLPESAVICVEGEMGAGKTTLIRHLCAALGVEDEVSSPTYALVNTYHTSVGVKIYHFDLYRIEDPEEALDIGIEEYLDDPSALKLIEWPERLAGYWPANALTINVRVNADDSRTISLRA